MNRFLILTLFFISAHKLINAQSLEVEYKKYRDSIQTLPSYDSVSFFKIADKLSQISKQLKSNIKRADVLHVIGTYYYFRQDYKNTNLYFDSALYILNKYPDSKLKNLIELKRSFILLNSGEYEKAKKFYENNEQIYVSQKDTLALIILTMAKGQIYQDEQRHDESVKYMLRSLQLAVFSKDKYYEATSRNNLAGEYQMLGKLDKAKEEYKQALSIAKKINNKKLASNITANLANILMQEKKYEEALKMFQDNLRFYENTNFFYEISYTYFSMANCYSYLNNTQLMKQYASKAIDVVQKNNLPVDALNIMAQVSTLFTQNKMFDESVALSQKTLLFAKENDLPIVSPNFYRNLSTSYEKLGNANLALQFHKKYTNQKDSLSEITNAKQANDLIFKYELSEKERKLIIQENENKLLRKQNELYILNRNFLIVVSILIILILIFTAFYFVQKRLKKQREEYAAQLIDDIDKERERIAMDLHDDLGLGITMVKQKILLLDCIPNDKREEIRVSLQDILEQTRNISRELYPATLKHLTFKEYLEPLLNSIEEKTGVICSLESNGRIDSYSLEVKMHLIRILQECIHNSLKYANAKAIRIELIYEKPKLQIIYYDNGIGINDKLKNKGLGMQNILQRSKQINADVVLSKNDSLTGTKLMITLYDRD